ncbi:MAG: hypothetical protein E6R07_01155 [Nevskiaceae bacterium]|nr:MAG: hypothetical protein E6R07_01155 [Nevskiaceae bacterium]
MAKLLVKEVLLSYDAPLVVLANDKGARQYVGVNYADADNEDGGYKFYFSRAKPEMIGAFKEGSFDLLYILTKKNIGKYLCGETWASIGDELHTRPLESIPKHALPKPGLFIPASTKSASTASRFVHIDGRWGINDLRKFSDLVQDSYAFVFALTRRKASATRTDISDLFRKYPWRGGFSSVNFFDDLYRAIPQPERASISSIQYASPGTIELEMNKEVATLIHDMVVKINTAGSDVAAAYKDVHHWLAEKKWLGSTASELRISAKEKDELRDHISHLTTQFGLQQQQQYVLELAKDDPLGAVKILLAYYRRLERLADYVATGKAQELFVKN